MRNGNCGKSCRTQRAAGRSRSCWCGDWIVGGGRWRSRDMGLMINPRTLFITVDWEPALPEFLNEPVQELAWGHDLDGLIVFWKMADVTGYEVCGVGR